MGRKDGAVMAGSGDGRRVRRRRAVAVRLAALLALAVVLTALVRLVPVAGLGERVFDDLRMALVRPAAPQNGDIALITITEETLAGLPYRSPVDRGFLADLVEVLADRQVRAIGFDLLIDRPSEPAKDARLAEVLTAAPVPVVLATTLEAFPMSAAGRAYHQAFLEGLDRGFANLVRDPIDGVVRRFLRHRDGLPSLPVALAEAVGRDIQVVGGSEEIAWAGRPDPATPVFPRYPAEAVALLPADWLAGRIALIGVDVAGSDRHRTALDLAGGSLAGVAVHAHVLAQLLDGRQVARLAPAADAALALLAALAGLGLARLAWAWPVKLAGGLVVALAWIGLAVAWFAWQGVLVGVTAPVAALAIAAGLEAGFAGRHLRAERRFIREAFAHYLSPSVVARLEADPNALKADGERRVCTFLFTDLAGFTALAESLEPETLSDLLNRYLGGLTEIVLRHDGTLDKFVGDAVVAFFGAPAEQPDQADRAVACAAEIDRFARTFRHRAMAGRTLGATRIGVHGGAAVVGNFGGANRFQFTAVGDAVNTAARLERANAAFATTVCVGAATAESVTRPELQRRLRPVGRLIVKGKTAPVAAFELMPDEEEGAALALAEPAAYQAAYRLMAAGDGAAAAAFADLARAAPDDPLVGYHAGRLADGAADDTIVLDSK